jgi:hypothetical protein
MRQYRLLAGYGTLGQVLLSPAVLLVPVSWFSLPRSVQS